MITKLFGLFATQRYYFNLDERYGEAGEVLTVDDYREKNPGGKFRTTRKGVYEVIRGAVKIKVGDISPIDYYSVWINYDLPTDYGSQLVYVPEEEEDNDER